jgi:D-inositol-3-phosphate glycosyltransferase
MDRVAMLSVHGCPLARLGTREAGGMQAYVRALSQELGRRGMGVDIFTRRSNPALPDVVAFGENARVIHLAAGEAAPLAKSALVETLPEFVCNLQRFRRQEGVDYQVVHSHYWLSGWVGGHLARRWDVPHLVMFHTLARLKGHAPQDDAEAENRAEVEERVIAGADRVIAATEHERRALVELYRARRDRVAVIPCGVDLDRFAPGDRDAARARLGLAGDVLLFVGRMDPIKGIDVLLGAAALLKERPSLSVVLVGGSGAEPEMRRTRELAARLGIDHLVQFRGAVPQRELAEYYRAATLTVVPSRYESFGLVPLESLACGTPVVGSKVGGLPAVIQDGRNGVLVPWRTPLAFAEALARLLDDPAEMARLRADARGSVLRFGWAAIADQILGLYRDITDARTPTLASSEGI